MRYTVMQVWPRGRGLRGRPLAAQRPLNPNQPALKTPRPPTALPGKTRSAPQLALGCAAQPPASSLARTTRPPTARPTL
jgi:hypothetical protein